jgi:hypothetical protein
MNDQGSDMDPMSRRSGSIAPPGPEGDVEHRYIEDFVARAQAAQEEINKLGAGPPDSFAADTEIDHLNEEVDYLRNAFMWIHYIASMHYIGQAFDPDHMRALANLAADALAGKDLPSFAEATERAQERASEIIDMMLEDVEE